MAFRRGELIALLGEESTDERRRLIQLKAGYFSLNVVALMVIGGFLVDLLRGGDGSPRTWIAVVGALSFVAALAFHSRRGQQAMRSMIVGPFTSPRQRGGPTITRLYGGGVEIRDLDPDDLDAALDVRNRSFGLLPPARHEGWRAMMRRALDDHRALGCYDGRRLVAVARINRYQQWWQGRSLPMAGVAGVVVAPEERGRGVGRLLMQATLERSAARDFALSALYPATLPLYRQCGWEIAGSQHLVSVPAEALRTLSTGPVTLRRVGPGDAEEILSVVRGIHAAARTSGPIDWEESEVRTWLAEDEPFAYLAGDGFLAYHWEGRDLEVDELVAGSGETARALWSLVGSGSSVAGTVKACVGPTDPLHRLTREDVVHPYQQKRWMLRLVDVPAALNGRGYPAGYEAELAFELEDPQLPANTGAWRLTVAKGTGRVERSDGGGGLRLGPRGLAALYAGTPLTSLRATGLATGGDPDTDPLFDTGFAARPYLLDYF